MANPRVRKKIFYDPDALKADIAREEKNIKVFGEEIDKAKERKMRLEFYLEEALENIRVNGKQ